MRFVVTVPREGGGRARFSDQRPAAPRIAIAENQAQGSEVRYFARPIVLTAGCLTVLTLRATTASRRAALLWGASDLGEVRCTPRFDENRFAMLFIHTWLLSDERSLPESHPHTITAPVPPQ